jgi:hypothetical protein
MYQQLWGYKVEEKLYLGVREQKRLNTAGLRHRSWPLDYWDRGFESRSWHGCLSLCFSVVLSCVGRGLCDGLITRQKESYQVFLK